LRRIEPEAGPLLRKFLVTRDDGPVESRRRILRLIETMTFGRTRLPAGTP